MSQWIQVICPWEVLKILAWLLPFHFMVSRTRCQASWEHLLNAPIACFRDLSSACAAIWGGMEWGLRWRDFSINPNLAGNHLSSSELPGLLGWGFKNYVLLDVLTLLSNKFIYEYIIYNFELGHWWESYGRHLLMNSVPAANFQNYVLNRFSYTLCRSQFSFIIFHIL